MTLDVSPVRHLVFSGGGAKGFAHIGAIKALDHKCPGFLSRIQAFAGTSIGAYVAFLVSLPVSVEAMIQTMLQANNSQLFRVLDVMRLFDEWGLCDKRPLIEHLRHVGQVLAQGQPDLTFEQHFQWTGKLLIVTAVNVDTGQLEWFRHDQTPHIPIWQAVLASMTLPFLFPPTCIASKRYIDGGMINNLPCDPFPPETTLALQLCRKPEPVRGLRAYLMQCLYIPLHHTETLRLGQSSANHTAQTPLIVEIDSGSVQTWDIHLQAHEKWNMIVKGFIEMYQKLDPQFAAQLQLHCTGKLCILFWSIMCHLIHHLSVTQEPKSEQKSEPKSESSSEPKSKEPVI